MLLTINFTFDYTFDTNHFFDTQAKKDLLVLAGHMLGDRLNDSLSAITPAGTNTWSPNITNPSTGVSINLPATTSVKANEIRIYVGTRPLGGLEVGQAGAGGFSVRGTQAWVNTVVGRGQAGALGASPTDTSVWGGSIAFDSRASFFFGKTTVGLTSSQSDFLPVAMHEIEHVLGFINVNPAFTRFFSGAVYVGPNSKAANGGNPIPLNPEGSHWLEGTKNDGIEAIMDPTLVNGTRKFTSRLDFAALSDMGWQVGTQDDTITTAPSKYTQLTTEPTSLVTISDKIDTSTAVDLFRVYLTAGSKFGARATPAAGFNAMVRIFDVAGTQLGFNDAGAAGVADNLSFTAPRTDYYYVGVSSSTNRGYNPNVANSGTAGPTGTYTLTLGQTNAAPKLTTGTTLAYTENQAATAINSLITVADADNPKLVSGTVKITNFVVGQDLLSFTSVAATMGNIVGTVNNTVGVVTLSSAGGTATLAQWQAALRAVKYSNSSNAPTTTTRTVTFTVDDGQFVNHLSNTLASSITITAVNDAPVLANVSTLAYTENQVATAINTVITVNDLDSPKLKSATVKITNFAANQDVLGFTAVAASMGNIVGTVNNAAGTVTLSSSSSSATLLQWQAALRAIKYSNSSNNPTTTNRSVTFTVDDGQAANHASNVITSTITIKAVNDAPVLAGPSTLAYVKNQAATAINTVITVNDFDNTTLKCAIVKIANFVAGQDLLSFTPVAASMGNIVATVDNTTGTVTLSSLNSTATLIQWQNALRAVKYNNSSSTPTTTTRSVTFTVDDGQALNHASNSITSTITIR